MKKPTRIYNQYDVVVVPFPFTDTQSTKRRPAIVISCNNSFNNLINHTVLVMITSARHSSWPLDFKMDDLDSAGLLTESIVRMKIFTLDNRLILRKSGHLSTKDKQTTESAIRKLLIS